MKLKKDGKMHLRINQKLKEAMIKDGAKFQKIFDEAVEKQYKKTINQIKKQEIEDGPRNS